MNEWKRRCRGRIIPAVVWLLSGAFTLLPWSLAQKAGSCLGRLTWWVCRRERRRTLEHLSLAFPDLPRERRLALGGANFRHLGTSAGELLHLFGRPATALSEHLRFEGLDEVCNFCSAGRPVLIVSGHCGNWELIAAACRTRGIPLVAIVRGLNDPCLQALATAVRGRFGCQVVVRGSRSSTGLLLRTLRGGGVLATLIDQDTRTEGVFVPFFGMPAYTPAGAARLALRMNAVVVPTFMQRLEDGSHLARFEAPLELPADPQEATALMTARIETQIRRCPEQWVWMHRRWHRQQPQASEDPSLAGLPVPSSAG